MTEVELAHAALKAWNRLICSDAEAVIRALQKHSFILKDPELWRAANDLNQRLSDFSERGVR